MPGNSCKSDFGGCKKVWKIVKSQGKVMEKSGNFEIVNDWQPCIKQTMNNFCIKIALTQGNDVKSSNSGFEDTFYIT